MLNRNINNALIAWKDSRIRRPLLVRGARQVGKTHSVEWFAKRNFKNYTLVNFEERPEMAACFDSFHVRDIVEKISLLTQTDIKPGESLLFLDEIQECPRAILALRYFFEKMPDLHIIGAGSLVEIAFRSENFRMPVGRITSIFMDPLTFGEFLDAMGHERLRAYLGRVEVAVGIDRAFNDEMARLLRKYLVVGGMPAAVAAYADNATPEEIKTLQTTILQTYKADFAKYAATSQHKYLKEVFAATPGLVGNQCKYTRINPHIQSRDLKNAISLLEEARCLYQVRHSAGHGVPLGAQTNPKKFKLLHLDVGLMQRALWLDAALHLDRDIMAINQGSVVEQFIGQQLLAAANPYDERVVFYWSRARKSSQAEVDYLVHLADKVFPVEVKSGKTGKLKSLRLFIDEHPGSPFGIRFSLHELSWHDNVLSIPLYMAEHWPRLATEILRS
ncbi:MAG: ATP-binding protein [Deltaproteobacteria bacterium]|nr:ATP-binding protein [Deltaproteobacteria bacterium]